MGFWGIVETHSQRENAAEDHLKRKGFEIYCPRIKINVVMRRGRIHRIVPLFPRYMFIRIEGHWYDALSAIGVLRLLRNGTLEPAAVADHIVKAIQAREVKGVVKLPKKLRPGDPVRIVRGTFCDLVGIYDGMGSKDRERVLLELLGRHVPVELSPADFQALAVAP